MSPAPCILPTPQRPARTHRVQPSRCKSKSTHLADPASHGTAAGTPAARAPQPSTSRSPAGGGHHSRRNGQHRPAGFTWCRLGAIPWGGRLLQLPSLSSASAKESQEPTPAGNHSRGARAPWICHHSPARRVTAQPLQEPGFLPISPTHRTCLSFCFLLRAERSCWASPFSQVPT